VPELLPDVLERSAVELPAPEVLERSADVLLPAPEVLERSAVVLPAPEVLERSAVELPAPEVLERSAEVLLPAPDVLERSDDELLEPMPLLEPLPVLEPLAPAEEPDSRISETVTSGAPCEAGKVTIATPYPFSILLEPEPLRPLDDRSLEVLELPLRPPALDDDPLRPLPELLERSAPDEELALRSVPVEDDEVPAPLVLLRSVPVEDEDVPAPLVLLRSVPVVEDEEPMPPLLDEDPEIPPELPELLSDRRLLLPEPPLVLLDLPDEFTGQFDISAGFETSPCTICRSLNESASAV